MFWWWPTERDFMIQLWIDRVVDGVVGVLLWEASKFLVRHLVVGWH